ncbi:unnamed protein product [marine sediment metagenome]|uniref:Type II secretion system protein GspE N-terminal domain-containing protein n=1 Tax=marine sediment metagenome TaxID=412755 RepID=X1MIC0_9ZZZZ
MQFGSSERPKLGEMLLEAKLIDEDQLKTVLDRQKETGGRLGDIVEQLGFIKEDKLIDFIAQQQELEVINLEEMVLPISLVKKISPELMKKYNFLPIGFRGGVLTIVTSDPTDYEAIEEIQLTTDWRVEVLLAPSSMIKTTMTEVLEHTQKLIRSKKELKVGSADKSESAVRKSIKLGSDKIVREALAQLLIEKNIITEEELKQKIKELKTLK